MSILSRRYLFDFIEQDLHERMVFIGGPRQVGKTTLAQSFIHGYRSGHPAYLNWDFPDHQKKIRNRDWPPSEQVVVFDEIHKMKNWRNLIKGYFDILKTSHRFIVTGSARLDYYKRGGDSLLGRYHYYRLHPLTLNEIGLTEKNLQILFTFGGFPEPYLKQDAKFLRRWHIERLYRLIHSDLRDLERVSDIDKVQLLAEELPNRVGSPLSIKSLAGDLQVDFKTASRWLSILDMLYYSFQIAPFGAPKIRAVKKEKKIYLWDFSQIEDPGIRFENMTACHLLKYCHFLQDTEGHRMELRYIRDTDKREVDFVVIKNKKPLFAVECKLQNKGLSSHLNYFSLRTNIPEFYQVHLTGSFQRGTGKVSALSFLEFCKLKRLV